MALTICLDIDGVLANFTKTYGDCLIEVGGDLLPLNWRDDPNFPGTWYWERAAGYSKEVEQTVWNDYILQEGSKFWQNLEPLAFARETLLMLNSRQKLGDNIWFVSHRMGHRAHQQTLTWLYNYGMDYPCLFFAADKVPYLRLLRANFFVDDKLETIQEVARVRDEEEWVRGLGEGGFSLWLKTAPYNTSGWNDKRFGNALSAKDALEQAGLWI